MWPFRRRSTALRVSLLPVTVGRHLAVRAAAGIGYVEGEGGDGPPPDFSSLPSEALLDVLDATLAEPPGRMRDRAALVALVARVWEAWELAVADQYAKGEARARPVILHTGQGNGTGESLTEAPPPEMLVGRLTLGEWAAVRDLPLWEAIMQRSAAGSVARFDRITQTN